MPTDRNRTVVAEGRFLRFAKAGAWEFVERRNVSGIVSVVAVTDDARIVFVEQYRPPVDARAIELPAGLVGDEAHMADESLADGARRELREETGFDAGEVRWLTRGPLTPGVSSEIVDFFLATKLRRVHDGGGVAGEDIVVHEVPLAEAEAWLAARTAEGVLVDPKCYMGLYFAARE